jgi:hypothetical protein
MTSAAPTAMATAAAAAAAIDDGRAAALLDRLDAFGRSR